MENTKQTELKQRLVFNELGNDNTEERKLIGGNSTGIANLNSVKYQWASKLYKGMLNNHWIPEKISLVEDRTTIKELTEDELVAFKNTLSFLVALDSMQTAALPKLSAYVTAPEISALFTLQEFQELIHSQSYQYLLQELFPSTDREEIYDYWRTNPLLLQRNKSIAGKYQAFAEKPTKQSFKQAIAADFALEGIYFYNPITSNIIEMNVKTIRVDGKTEAYTKDVQQADIQYTTNYRLDSANVHNVYRDVGKNWDEVLTPQVITGTIKSVIGTWEAVPLVENRQNVAALITEAIAAKLLTKGVIVDNFELTNIDYTKDFNKAVEDKVTAIQRASEAKNKTVQVQEEANQKVIAAKAEAESMRIRSEALSQNKSLVDYEAVQKWNGVLPQYVMGGAVPFMNLTK